MSRFNPELLMEEGPELNKPEVTADWPLSHCETSEGQLWILRGVAERVHAFRGVSTNYEENWAEVVPQLLNNVTSLLAERKKQELQFNILRIAITQFEKRINRLESFHTRMVPVATFAPEPYCLSEPILVSISGSEEGFNAGWFDANIHTSGDNEEEAVNNLKSLILDLFDQYSKESPDQLGPEPTRQLAVLREYIHKSP